MSRKEIFRALKFIVIGLIGSLSMNAQSSAEGEDEEALRLLNRPDTIENPVFMPVVGIGAGYLNFYGDASNSYGTRTVGKPALKINVSSYIGQTKSLRANLTFMVGDLYGQKSSPSDTALVNFKTSLYSFGFNLHYSFKPLIKGKYLEPFISIGLETVSFNSKADFKNADGERYHYWNDGTIRTVSELAGDPTDDHITQRDYNYETDLRSANLTGLRQYSNFSFAVPIDVGFDINITDRLTIRTGTSLHYSFTDLLDGMPHNAKNEAYRGKKGNDWFTFSYVSLHLDLFSQDKVEVVEELFANADDYDMALYDDQDGDGVFDGWDDCPETPPDVPVDSMGCPFDEDGDGVPDYIDRERSRPGAVVDEFGEEIGEHTIVALLGQPALARRDVEAYLSRSARKASVHKPLPIPDKFKQVDKDRDGEISFDELLAAINAYFDGTSGYSSADISELCNFFFEQ